MSDLEVHINERRVLNRGTTKEKRRISDVSNEYQISLAREKQSSEALSAACGLLNGACEEFQKKMRMA